MDRFLLRKPFANATPSTCSAQGKRKRQNDDDGNKERSPDAKRARSQGLELFTDTDTSSTTLDSLIDEAALVDETLDTSSETTYLVNTVSSRPGFDAVALRARILAQLPQQWRHRVEAFLRQSLLKPSGDLSKAFMSFSNQEVVKSGKPSRDLVRPSGDLNALLGIKLHYPTRSGKNMEHGQVLNDSFACIRVLLQKGLPSNSQLFWYESFFRRESTPTITTNPRKTPLDSYSAEVLQLHASFASWCEEHGSFKIVLLGGAHVEKAFLRRYKPIRITISGSSNGLLVVKKDDKICRIGIPMPHPQYYLMSLTGRTSDPETIARNFDQAVNIAVALSGLDLSIDENYFERLLKHRSTRTSLQVFNANPRLAMIEGLQQEKEDSAERTFRDLPQSIVDWLKKELGTENVRDVEQAVTSSTKSCLQMVQAMMTQKGNKNRTLNLDEKRRGSNIDLERTVVRKPKTPIPTHCEVCKSDIIMDESPLFGTFGSIDGVYIARITKACKSGCCLLKKNGGRGKTPRSIDLIPVDKSIRFITQLEFRKLCQEEKEKKIERRSNGGTIKKFFS